MRYFVVDAFTDTVFGGNPAGVCLLDTWLPDETMQHIAAENNLSETAFLVPQEGGYGLRWFTPAVEINLCGHATLASGFVVSRFVDKDTPVMRFYTQSGLLTVTQKGELYEMDFPAWRPKPAEVTPLMSQALGTSVREAHLSRDLLLLVDKEEQVQSLTPDLTLLAQIPGCFGVIVTAQGTDADFVSRFFAPNAGIPEDPVTGSAHSTLIPYWAERLGKDTMTARQLSVRGGTLYCEQRGDRVRIAGQAVLYLQGEILL